MMLPKISIDRYKKLVQVRCMPHIRQGQRRQFLFGLDTLAARPFVSLNSNARSSVLSRSAAESKMFRLLRNDYLRQQLSQLHLSLCGVVPTSYVNVDHSEFNGLSVLMFAQQTRTGRATPVHLETMPSLVQGHKKTSRKYQQAKQRYQAWKEQTGLDQYGYTIRCLEVLHGHLGYLPRLVFDRGFCNKRILKYLKRSATMGYVRAREDFRVTDIHGARRHVGDFPAGSHTIQYGCKLRLVVSRTKTKAGERIYILSTDFTSSYKAILQAYYYRFEIEELFRDLKSLLGTKRSQIKKPTHLATLLWFICLGITLLLRIATQCDITRKVSTVRKIHPKKQLSYLRQLLESYEQALRKHAYVSNPGDAG